MIIPVYHYCTGYTLRTLTFDNLYSQSLSIFPQGVNRKNMLCNKFVKQSIAKFCACNCVAICTSAHTHQITSTHTHNYAHTQTHTHARAHTHKQLH